ncbi:MAG: T9SS type A sorting domain-containing protein [Chitinophagaceae bacterium]|nr:T9SS type A sorting domain-containing protein [Chitinophagaceae bacterium]
MKNLYVRRLFFSRFLLKFHFLIWTLFFIVTPSVAQQKLIQLDGWNCYINLPADYEQTSNKYPTIVFLPGIGEVGTDANKIIANGPGAYVTQGWNGEVLGVKFIVVSLQPVNTWPSSAAIKTRLENLKSKYRIGDIYLTGLSMGGWAVLSYSHEYPTEPKAVVSVEGVIPSAGYNSGDGPWADYIQKYYEAPIKAGQRYVIFEQKNDLRGGNQVIVAANYWKPGSGNYILTNFGGGGHCCWNEFYGGQGKQPGIFNIDGINQNIYEWFARNYLQGNSNNNKAPKANAGPDKTLTLPDNSITLDGSGTDEDGTIVSYSWTKIAGPSSFNILSPGSASTNINGLSQGVYKFQLKVTDNEGAIGLDTVQVTVNPAPNKSPKANAGEDQSITLPLNLVSLSGSGIDEDGTIIGFKWSKISGPSSYNIKSPASASTDISELTEGMYEFELEVTDDKGAKGLDTVKVIVNPAINKPPVANAGSDKTIQLPVNNVVLNGSGTDEDGTIVSFTWRKKSGPEDFSIVTAEAASTEVNGLVEGIYVFELVVTDDGGASDTASVKITVIAAENIPPKAMAGSDQEITLPTNMVSLSGSGTDDDGTVVFFRWSKISGPSSFTITNPDDASTNISGLTEGVYEFQLKVTDNDGAFGLDTVRITVNPAPNKSPKANAGADQTITLPANTVSLAGSGTDEDGTVVSYQWTKISGPSGYTIVNSGSAVTDVFGLTEGVYSFQLEVTDNKGAKGRDTMQVTVNAAPNQAPTANAGADQTITLPTNKVTLKGSGTDADGTISSYQWTKTAGPGSYTIVSPASATTEVTGLTEGTYTFQLKVTDNKGATGTATVRVTVVAADNQAPTANAGGNKTIVFPESATTLTGSGSDADGTIEKYAWKQLTGPTIAEIESSGSATTAVSGLAIGNYLFELTVTDNRGAVGKDTMILMVAAARENSYQEGVKLYPNPTSGITTLEITGVKITERLVLVITDATGKVVEKRDVFTAGAYHHLEKVDMRNMRQGIYFVSLLTESKVKLTQRVVKL